MACDREVKDIVRALVAEGLLRFLGKSALQTHRLMCVQGQLD
jgi:hypothetical protein